MSKPTRLIVTNEANNKKPILFSSVKVDSGLDTSKVFLKFIPFPMIDKFMQWNKYAKKRPNIDIEEILSKRKTEHLIKQLKTNKFQRGIDIVPYYLLKKPKKS